MADKRDTIWTIVHTVTVGHVLIEISCSDGYSKRYSYRITWHEGERRGPWFPESGISFVDDLSNCSQQAEAWILEQTEKVLKEKEERLKTQRETEMAKRKRHDENVNRRKEENRKQANRNSRS